MNLSSYRFNQLGLCVLSTLVLGASFYLEWFKELEPCPLCLMQRYLVLIALCGSLLAAFKKTKKILLFTIFQSIISLSGLYFALRQLWLQSLPPDKLPACLPGLEVLLQYFPLKDILHALFWGTAECTEITWSLLGLSLTAWSALFFLSYGLMVLFLHFRVRFSI